MRPLRGLPLISVVFLASMPAFAGSAVSKLDAKILAYLEEKRGDVAEACNGADVELEINLSALEVSSFGGKGGNGSKSPSGGGEEEGELRVPQHVLASFASPCGEGLDALYRLCTSNSNAES